MPEQNTMTRSVEISEAKKTLSSLVNEVGQGKTRILVEKSSTPVAALISVDDLARLERFDREWEEGTKAIERFSQAFADVPVEVGEAEIARIIADIRRQNDAEAERQSA